MHIVQQILVLVLLWSRWLLFWTNAFATVEPRRFHLHGQHVVASGSTSEFARKQQQQQVLTLSKSTKIARTILYSSRSKSGCITPGDTVVVIGGTGGVGQLVGKKLNSGQYGTFSVRVTSRNVESAMQLLNDDTTNPIQCLELDLVGTNNMQQLKKVLDGTSAIVISVGTTAFPTKRWWGGNTPNAIDNIAVTNIINVATQVPSIKKIVLVTSVGVTRTDTMPFTILNLFGVLDAKKAGEDILIQSGIPYVIIRPGRLVGGPFTNLDVAKLLQIQGGTENGVMTQHGDALLGDCKRDACSEAIVQCLLSDNCANIDFSIISDDTIPSLSSDDWRNEFNKLSQQQPSEPAVTTSSSSTPYFMD